MSCEAAHGGATPSGKNHVIAVCGATATGKSRLASELARRIGGEIVSCDSMQIYRGMDIGTAKPTAEELLSVRHHMIDIVSVNEPYSVAEYADAARAAIAGINSRGHTAVICGGTGLYLDALLYDNKYSDAPETGSGEIRERLNEFARQNGADALYKRLCGIDPQAAAATHPNNVRRVVRALEIYECTGKTKTEWDTESRGGEASDIPVIGLKFSDRELHREAILRRCCEMFSAGLAEEARSLYEAGALEPGTSASQAIGYKELIPYLRGVETADDALTRLYYSTCRYAKRQATWFNKKPYISWLCVDGAYRSGGFEDIVLSAMEIIGARM